MDFVKTRMQILNCHRKKGVLFSFIYFFRSLCMYYIPHSYAIPQALSHAIPQTHFAFYPHRNFRSVLQTLVDGCSNTQRNLNQS